MEIIFKTNKNQSNFDYCANIYKNKSILNGFNKMTELMLCEPIAIKEIDVQNIFFEKEIVGDLYICYPLSVVVKETIKFSSLHDIIKGIRKVYKAIYKEERQSHQYGIWGHNIYDLVIEAIKLYKDPETNKVLVDVSIGS